MNNDFGLYLILTDPAAGYETCTEAAVAENIRYLQLRMKNRPRTEVLDMARKLRKITAGTETRFIINDDLETAMACDADGVHLGQDDLSIEQARAAWNTPGKIFGLSTHSMEQAEQAAALRPDYIGIGPVFPTATKTDTDPEVGPAETGRIAQAVSVPSVAIGGINAANLPEVLKAGARNYCVVSAVNASPDPRAAIRALQAIWTNHRI